MKKGDTWVSAVLYIALGTIVVTILLAAGMPVVNKLRDRNVILETKQVMHGMNNAVRTVMREGPGSQRSVVIDIGRGELVLDGSNEWINWSMESKTIFSEPDLPVYEGDLILTTRKTKVSGKYLAEIALSYKSLADIQLKGDSTIIGRRNLIFKHAGLDGNGRIIVEIRTV